MSPKIEASPDNVQIVLTNKHGDYLTTICLLEGSTAEEMAFKLSVLEDNNFAMVSSVFVKKGRAKQDFIDEWKKLVSEDKTTFSLEEWYCDTYLSSSKFKPFPYIY